MSPPDETAVVATVSHHPSQRPRVPDVSIRALSRDIVEAADAQVRQIVAIVDSLAARGAADEVIAPIRPRLSELRPTRPLRFARLLFLPLDPLIVPTCRWKPEQCTVPRSALSPLCHLVERALGDKASAVKRVIQRRSTGHGDLVSTLGNSLWPDAGTALREADAPAGWNEPGISRAEFRDLARRMGAVLTEAPALDLVYAETALGLLPPNRAAVETMLRRVSASTPEALPMLVALLLTRLPKTIRQLDATGSGGIASAIQSAADQATKMLLDHFDKSEDMLLVTSGTLAEAGAAAGRLTDLLAELDRDTAPATRRAQISALRQQLHGDIKVRFVGALTRDLLQPLRTLPDRPGAVPVDKLEATARSLRLLEIAGRGIGGPTTYDRLLAEAVDVVQSETPDNRLTPSDRLRLVEILAGSEAALRMLDPR